VRHKFSVYSTRAPETKHKDDTVTEAKAP